MPFLMTLVSVGRVLAGFWWVLLFEK